eukprot:101847-Pyramimonas_sp.AAC.1
MPVSSVLYRGRCIVLYVRRVLPLRAPAYFGQPYFWGLGRLPSLHAVPCFRMRCASCKRRLCLYSRLSSGLSELMGIRDSAA